MHFELGTYFHQKFCIKVGFGESLDEQEQRLIVICLQNLCGMHFDQRQRDTKQDLASFVEQAIPNSQQNLAMESALSTQRMKCIIIKKKSSPLLADPLQIDKRTTVW